LIHSNQIVRVVCFAALSCTGVRLPAADPPPAAVAHVAGKQVLTYAVEWRLIRAGTARLESVNAVDEARRAELRLTSAGLVNKLYRVNDLYRVSMTPELCAENVVLNAEEGKRRRETKIAFSPGHLAYTERDLIRNTIVLNKEMQTPPCVHEYMGAMAKLRSTKLDPGQSMQLPMTDGKKVASVKVEAQERENIRIGDQNYSAIRYEVHMFNNVLLSRKARMYVWITDDNRRLPVQLRVKLSVLVGTITLNLEKVE
jgi:hypothetical protein